MLLNIEPGLMIWTLVTFVLLLIVLRAVAWKPLLKMLDEREGRIQDALERGYHVILDEACDRIFDGGLGFADGEVDTGTDQGADESRDTPAA